jgi:hypothetical protein
VTTPLLVCATLVALVNIPTCAGLLAWGLSGGDGEPRNPAHAVMALLLMLGALAAVAGTFAAFGGLSTLRWASMWVAPVVAVGAVLLVDDGLEHRLSERLTALWMPAGLAVPPVLVRLAGAVA